MLSTAITNGRAAPAKLSRHIVLLGDSILDNGAYVDPGHSVVEQLGALLSGSGRATLLARDGSIISSVGAQLASVPADASLLVISAGGNDALRATAVFETPTHTVGDAVIELRTIVREFAANYEAMLDRATTTSLPTVLCTIYDVQFDDDRLGEVGNTALGLLNDAITRAAARRLLPVLDLRVMFSERADYANAIEPSVQGAGKLARGILRVAKEHRFEGAAALYWS
jgi:hypothetical protein